MGNGHDILLIIRRVGGVAVYFESGLAGRNRDLLRVSAR